MQKLPIQLIPDFSLYKDKNFPEGKQQIYLITGDMSAHDFHDALYISPLLKVNSFENWGDFAKWIQKDDKLAKLIIEMRERDGDFDEKSDQDCKMIKEAMHKEAKNWRFEQIMSSIMNCKRIDPYLLVREYDPMFMWLRQVRESNNILTSCKI